MKENIKVFTTALEAADKLAEDIFSLAEQTIICKGKFHLAISGGNTPIPLYLKIANRYSEEDWENIHLYWVDERCMSHEDEQSNFQLAKKYFIHKTSIPEANIHRIRAEAEPEKEAIRYAEELRQNLNVKDGLPSFDLILMGVGEDGHIASIFPENIALLNSGNICEVSKHPVTNQKCITLTGKIINNADEVIFFVTGEDKAKIMSEIFYQNKAVPASHIKPKAGKIVWYLDKEAEKMIEN